MKEKLKKRQPASYLFTIEYLKILLLLAFLPPCLSQYSYAQNDTSSEKKDPFFHNIFNAIKSSIFVSKEDSIHKATVINNKSIVPFVKHQGKMIRKIYTDELGFERTFTDTSQFANASARLLNKLHTNTRDWVIRDNLFIKEGSRLNPYILADNERFLRSLEFIQDARILVKPIKGASDSVDILVVTKDFFSITGSLDFSGISRQRVSLAETNLAGAGQKVQLTVLHDPARHPAFGTDFLYSKTNLRHTFINGTVGYSRIKSDRGGNENVQSAYLLLDRPLFSTQALIAGGFELSFNGTKNLYGTSDSLFYDYRNTNFDIWSGYNFGARKLPDSNSLRNRTFIALRFVNNNFSKKPFQVGDAFNVFYNDRTALLAEITFFKQEFVSTNFIYNFGTTEDVPYGHNVALTAGWYRQNKLARPYYGINANKYFASKKGNLTKYFIRTGFFINSREKQWEDVSLLLGGSMYSRVKLYHSFKYRHYVKFSFTRLFNRIAYEPLKINNELGLRYFSADTLEGTQRMSVYAETFFFPRLRLIGFQFSPFVFADASLFKGEGKPFFSSDIFTGVGGGVRTRNVNLIFPTVEVRIIFFPRKVQNINSWLLTFSSNIRFKYNNSYVRAPDVIQVNSEDAGSFY